MISSWLSKTSTAALCAVAIAGLVPSLGHPLQAEDGQLFATSADNDADMLRYDNLGNLVWSESTSNEASNLISSFKESSKGFLDEAKETFQAVKEDAQAWQKVASKWANDKIHESSISIDNMHYMKLVHPAFPNHALRISTSSDATPCDPDVKSYTGYLDVGQDKHFWFAFFESRARKTAQDKSKEPIVMWLNGGPGCSSSTGWLMEGVGPCTIDKNGTSTKYNEHSWTNKASVFFLDQPVNVGFSYSESGDVNNTPDGADDVYAFLSLFFAKFTEYSDSPFSIAAESYGGRYAPLIASKIHQENKNLQFSSVDQKGKKPINLETIMIGNGLTDPKTQFGTVYDYACKSKYAIFDKDSQQCQSLKSKSGTCTNLIEQCYKYNSRLTCTPAGLYCWSSLYGDAQNSGRNLYDVRRKCDRSPDKDGQLCYRDELYVETYMNRPEIKKAYGVPESVEFQACNMNVNQAFLFNGDGMHNSAEVLPEMIEDGIRVLVYAGEADFMCNYIGNTGESAWALTLDHKYQEELVAASHKEWTVASKKAGSVRQAGKGAGSVTLVTVSNAGHMVPYDQPSHAQAMVESWLANKPIA